MYCDSASPIFHGFTWEMQQAAFQWACAESNNSDSASSYLKFPPDKLFLDKCRSATRMRKKLADYKWEKVMYPPIGSADTPPTERQWKVTDAGQQFLRDNPNAKAGVDTALNNLVSMIVNPDNVIANDATKNNEKAMHGFVRIKNSESDEYDDFDYGLDTSDISVDCTRGTS